MGRTTTETGKAMIRIEIPAPCGWLNLNHRTHWAAKAKLTKSWRNAAYVAARAACLPRGLDRVRIVAYIHKTTNRSYDAHNLMPTLKACVDGVVGDYGLVPADTNRHVIGPDIRMGNKRPFCAVTLEIEELEGGAND